MPLTLNKKHPSLTLYDAPVGTVKAVHPDNRANLWKDINALAGARWMGNRKFWYVADDYVDELQRLAYKHGLLFRDRRKLERGGGGAGLDQHQLDPRLYSFQHDAVYRALKLPSFMFNFEMGLGKTPCAIECLKHKWDGRGQILIVCPAGVRQTWVRELGVWWKDHPPVLCAEDGDALEQFTDQSILIVSYALLNRIEHQFDYVVVDESHHAKDGRVALSKTVYWFCERARHKYLLTATPLKDVPDLHHQLHCLYPHRFGSFWQFVRRYCHVEDNEWGGKDIGGLREEMVHELRVRLEKVSARVTKKEVAHLLPPFTTEMVKVSGERDTMRELVEDFDTSHLHKEQLKSWTLKSGAAKLGVAVEEIERTLPQLPRLMVLTHYRQTARELCTKLLEAGYTPFHIDGSVPTKKRAERIKLAAGTPGAVLVSTMHAVKEGIDLTAFTYTLCIELYYSPIVMIQVLGRFHRLSSQEPGHFKFLVLKGTLDEVIAGVLDRRIEEARQLMESGVTEDQLSNAFGGKLTEAEMLKQLRAAAAERDEFDEYI